MTDTNINTVAAGQLQSIVQRIERLDEEKAAAAEGIKEVLAEAKGSGFDTKIIRKVVAIRKRDRAAQQEEGALVNLYLTSLGELPLFA